MHDYQIHFQEFKDRSTLAACLAADVSSMLKAHIVKKKIATLVVSGGSTPVLFFHALAKEDISWSHVIITLADERWVKPDHNDSNEHLVREHLLQDRAASAIFFGLKTEETTAIEGEKSCGKKLLSIPLPFDILVLGMGSDGHTASLFPGSASLAQATDMQSGLLCTAINPLSAEHERMTLTLPALATSRQIILHITGREKLKIFEKAVATAPVSPSVLDEMPIRHVLAWAGAAVTVYWAP